MVPATAPPRRPARLCAHGTIAARPSHDPCGRQARCEPLMISPPVGRCRLPSPGHRPGGVVSQGAQGSASARHRATDNAPGTGAAPCADFTETPISTVQTPGGFRDRLLSRVRNGTAMGPDPVWRATNGAPGVCLWGRRITRPSIGGHRDTRLDTTCWSVIQGQGRPAPERHDEAIP